MKVYKTRAEREKDQERLTELLAKRNQLRDTAFLLGRKIKRVNDKIFYQDHRPDGEDTAKKEYLLDTLRPLEAEREQLKGEIRTTTKEINRIKLSIRYFENNDLEITPAETTIAFALFGKRYHELNADELREYNKLYHRERRKRIRQEKNLNIF